MKYLIGIGLVVLIVSAGVWYGIDYFTLNQSNLEPGRVVQIGESTQSTETDQVPSSEPVPYTVVSVATGLEVPWSIVFTSDSRMLVTERPGRVRVIEKGQLLSQPVLTIPEVSSQSEEGLMGMALDPDYESNQLIYLCYAYPQGNGLADRVVSVRDNGDSLDIVQTIIEGIPAARNHAGCRLGFGPDGKLYITTGDATDAQIAQDMDSLGGKILRLNKDGSIPSDNPFANSLVYSLGHRNPQGIAWHPETGQLFSTEHGPSGFDGPGGGDEVNLIRAGENYGWPSVSHQESQDGLVDPLLVFTPAEAPGSAMFYSGDVFPQFQNNFFFGALRGQGIIRVQLNPANPAQVSSYEKLDLGNLGRIREVTQGPDGYIYFTTSNRDGRGDVRDGDDHVYRIVPE